MVPKESHVNYSMFVIGFFSTLRNTHGVELHFRRIELAHRYRVPLDRIRDLILLWARQGFITLRVWDGRAMRPWHKFRTAAELFADRGDSDYVLVKLMPATN